MCFVDPNLPTCQGVGSSRVRAMKVPEIYIDVFNPNSFTNKQLIYKMKMNKRNHSHLRIAKKWNGFKRPGFGSAATVRSHQGVPVSNEWNSLISLCVQRTALYVFPSLTPCWSFSPVSLNSTASDFVAFFVSICLIYNIICNITNCETQKTPESQTSTFNPGIVNPRFFQLTLDPQMFALCSWLTVYITFLSYIAIASMLERLKG